MKKHLAAVLVFLATIGVLQAQSFYMVSKNQYFVQTSAAGAAADPLVPFSFRAQAATSATLTLPGGSTAAIATPTRDKDYRLEQNFATKAALDAAFPNGTYRMAGAAIPTLSLNLPADNYPVTPQVTSVTNGTWNSGILVVNPAQSVTLNFNPFSGYATSGVAGHINLYVAAMTQGDTLQLETEMFSQPIFGSPAQPTPLTSYTIPAGRLTSGRIYRVWLGYDTVASMDATVVAGSAVGALYSKELSFYLAAQTPGTSTPAPVIVTQPASRTAVIGGSATFSADITVGGTSQFNMPFVLNWTRNGQDLGDIGASGGKYAYSGATGGPAFGLTINSLTAADAGDYAVTVVTAGGIAVSSPATLSFTTASAPAITTQPRGATVNAGTTVALTVAATGAPTPSFQWRKDGNILFGATGDTLVLSNISTANGGDYTVVVSNPSGNVTSNTAAVTVTANQPSQLPNLSVRTNLGAAQTLFVGFSTTGSKTMLLRAVGPTLAGFGLSGTHPDPLVELYSGSTKIDDNNDWSTSLTPPFAGAFPLASGSKDAALQRACNGSYTAQVKGPGAGVLLVEAYDIGGTGKLMNVSARNLVGTDDNILMAGFVVQGGAAKTLLIRGVGARLADLGVSGVLADPKLEIYTGAGVKVAENDNWNAQLQSVARSVGAFDLTPNSRDAALLITLAPGDYTAQVSGVGRTTGEAIVEVYEVP